MVTGLVCGGFSKSCKVRYSNIRLPCRFRRSLAGVATKLDKATCDALSAWREVM